MSDMGVEFGVAGGQSPSGTPGQPPTLELLEQLGHGATTTVYRARPRGTAGPEIAIKMLRERTPDATQRAAAYRREAALVARINHPNVTTVHAAGETNGRPWLALELVDGATLAHHLSRGPFPEHQTLRIATDTAHALAAVHHMRLVHRDIKPGNLMITPSGHTKLIDFDLATWAGEPAPDGTVAGTLTYSAPEQTGMFARPVDARADLYALGVVLYECITGEPPFTTTDVGELLHLHAVEPPPPIHRLRPDCTPALAAIVTKLLAKDPDDRYQTATSLANDLDQLQAHPTTWPFPLDTTTATTHAEPALVGRESECELLIQRWNSAVDGKSGVVVLDGPVGAGAGRLVSELIETVTQRGGCALRARCAPDDAMPAAALRTAVEQHVKAIQRLPHPDRDAAEQRLRRAAGIQAPLLTDLSPALSGLLQTRAVPPIDHDRRDQVAAAIAGFLGELAELEGGLVLALHDAHHIDRTTRRVLQYLRTEYETAPLLIVLTTSEPIDELQGRLATPPDTRIPLGPLERSAVGELVANELGGTRDPGTIADQLAARTGGNPFGIIEYIRRLIDAGGLEPSWGAWTLDTALLDRLQLPSDVLDLMLTRLDGLDTPTCQLLATAAVQGMRFNIEVLEEVTGAPELLAEVIAVATRNRVVEHAGGDVYAFVHSRLHDALASHLDGVTRARLHERTAEALESRPRSGATQVFEIARHRIAAGEASRPARTYAACVAAGNLALSHQAPAEAAGFFTSAARAVGTSTGFDTAFRQAYATALMRSGDLDAAREQLRLALDSEQDGLARATLFELVAKVQISESEGDQAIASVRQGLAELGATLPQRMPRLVISSFASVVTGAVVEILGRGPTTAQRRARYTREASLLDTGAQAAPLSSHASYLLLLFPLRGLLPAIRIGLSPQRTRILAALGLTLGLAGARRLGLRICAAADRDAAILGDPALVAASTWMHAIVKMRDVASHRPLVDQFDTHSRWMDLPDYLMSVDLVAPQLHHIGYTTVAEDWVERARERLHLSGATQDAFAVECVASAVQATRRHASRATTTLQRALDRLERPPTERQRMHAAWATLTILSEQGEFGAAFDDAVSAIDEVHVPFVADLKLAVEYTVAAGRLAQAQSASGDERRYRLAQARRALRWLRLGRPEPRFRAGRLVLRAWALHVRGRDRTAQRTVHRALHLVDSMDAPAMMFDALRIHARILHALGRDLNARQQARFALTLATEHGWDYRAGWIRDEFGLESTLPGSPRVRGGQPAATSSGSDVHLRRRLEALQQVSSTAASVLDPDELIRTALDVTLRLLSAERAFLFLADHDTLRPHRGRDADGNDLSELGNYSSTLVERVRQTGEALMVTGSEQGAALGSHSAVRHGLRSILAAPLQAKDRLLGVIYLDSRIARGIFTAEDVELLATINQQVAASLETARAAQLDAEIQAANRQRSLAETLNTSMTDLNSTLDPDEVLRRLLSTVTATVPADTAILLRHEASHLVVAAYTGTATPDADRFDPESHPTLHLLATTDTPLAAGTPSGALPLPPALAALLDRPQSWLAVPIGLRQQRTGVIIVGSAGTNSYTDVEVKIAAVLGHQGAVAYDNARLFTRAHEAATIDALTSLATRHHFWELAEQALATAIRHQRPLGAIMVDIDRFKAVNDTHGHAGGDTVLREVASRIRSTLRDADIVGRYGGEEFAILVPESSDVAPLAERLRTRISETPITLDDGHITVTISAGVSYLEPDDDLDNLLVRADAALYRSKAGGRNRVTVK